MSLRDATEQAIPSWFRERFRRARQATHWWFVVPALLFYIPFFILPAVALFALSFFKWSGFSGIEFIGLANYVQALTDPVTYTALWHNVQVAVFYEVFIFGGGLVLALAIRASFDRLRQFFQVTVLLPIAMMSVAVSFIWSYLYNPSYGALNILLEEIPFINAQPIWLGDPNLVLYAIIFVGIWQWVGFNAAIWLAGLGNIDQRLYEAARIDGANRLQVFRHITMPLLRPIALFIFILALIGAFKTFGYFYIMTRGGPGHASEVMVTWIYKVAFKRLSMGRAAALSVILFAVTGIVSYINFRLGQRGAGGPQQ